MCLSDLDSSLPEKRCTFRFRISIQKSKGIWSKGKYCVGFLRLISRPLRGGLKFGHAFIRCRS